MKKFLLLILLFSSLIASSVQQKINLTSDEKLFIKQHPVIEVGGELDWPPFDFVVDGKYRCVANDYLELISQRTGLKFNVTTGYSWNELLKMFHEKKFDLMPMIYISPERAKSFSFTKKYLTVREYIFVTQDQQNIATFDDLAHLTLAVPKGYAQIEIIHKKYPNINILEVGSPLDAIDALLTQKADAMLENTAVVAYMLKQNHITGLKPAFATDIGINELYMATQKDMPQLLSIVQKALDSITKDEKEKIENRWMSVVATHVGIDLTQEEKDFIKQHPVIRVSNEKNWAPYDYNEGGEPKGYAVEYIKMLSQMSGLKLEFVTDSWDNLMQNFQERKIDLLNIAYKTQKREENALFSDSYLENDLSIVTQIREKRFYNLESLSGQKVALVKGWTSTEEIKKKYPKIEVYEVKDSLELVEAVAHGDVVAGIDDLLTINYYTKLKLLPNLRLAGNVELEDISTKMFIGVRKDWPLLQQILNKAIQQVDSANLLEFNSKWLHQHQLNFTQRIELTHAEQHYLQKKKRILFCTDTQLEPWSTINNGYNVGMSADISGLFSNIIGVPVELKLTKTNAEAVETAKKRGCDILLARVKSQVAQKYMDFTSPYMENSVVIITGIDQAFLNDFSELAGKKIGIIKGDFINQALKFKYPKISFIEVDTLEEGLDKVADKELDGQLSALFIGSYFIQKKYLNVLKISGMSSVTMQLRIATRNDEPLLNSVFEKAIQILDRKELRRIANKWTDQSHEKEIDYSLVWKLVILFILVILFFISRNRQLTKHKKEIELKNKELENTNKNLEEQKKKVDFIAFHDHLTGLPNRRNLRERLEHAIGIAKRNDKKVYTLFIDLDRFKIVNDTLGHDIGDEMLKVVATRLQSLLRKSDTLAREGGDEFIIVLEDVKSEHDVISVIEKILLSVKEPIAVKEYNLTTTCSIGIARYPDDGDSVDTLIKNADSAMYLAKDQGKNNYQYYTQELLAQIKKRLEIEHELRYAVQNDEFYLVFQPQYSLADKRTIGAEALIRWESHKFGKIAPDEFIPIAEDSGLIIEIGEWVFEEACKTFAYWKTLGLELQTIAVNVSSIQFNQKDIVQTLQAILQKYGLSAHEIEIEITERYIMHHTENNMSILNELQNAGFKISVDDFGTGYSSMSYLKKLPLDTIKIDKSFIDDTPHDQNDVAITKAIIALSKSLEYNIIAEGIENREQEIFLQQEVCDMGQGYFFSRPLTSDEFIAFCKAVSH